MDYNAIKNSLSNFDNASGVGTIPTSSGVGVGLVPQKGNPTFKSQIDLNVSVVYSYFTGTCQFEEGGLDTVNINSHIQKTSLELPQAIKTGFPVYLFGHSDFAGGFSKANQLLNQQGAVLIDSRIVTEDSPLITLPQAIFSLGYSYTPLTIHSFARSINKLSKGDLLLTYLCNTTSVVTSSENNVSGYIVEVIVKCKDVAYGTLLNSISSDLFTIGGIRYTVPTVANIGQFDNSIYIANQTLFGKVNNDSINPNSMKIPSQNQDNIIDVPLNLQIDKSKILAMLINYDCPSFTLSLFIPTVAKLK